jgi:ubiquinone/menaquinone biosynthesis C-methylase UbiE
MDYYERRAPEYDATSWDHPDGDPRIAEAVRSVIASVPPRRTLDIGCGTAFVSRWLPGELTLLDASESMLAIARRRLPAAHLVRAAVPPLPFADRAFGRAFAANLYGHLLPPSRAQLVNEMRRVADEVMILEQVAADGRFREGPEERDLLDGTRLVIHKCYFTVEQLQKELRGGDILMNGPAFAIVRA